VEILSNLGLGLETAFTLTNLLYCLIGVFVGTAVGVPLGASSSMHFSSSPISPTWAMPSRWRMPWENPPT
jgi:TctA family transporter